jgi:alpha-L-rhamnosidase
MNCEDLLPRWATAGFDDAAWRAAEMVAGLSARQAAQPSVPLRVTETLRPGAVTEPQPGTFIFDLSKTSSAGAECTCSAARAQR